MEGKDTIVYTVKFPAEVYRRLKVHIAQQALEGGPKLTVNQAIVEAVQKMLKQKD